MLGKKNTYKKYYKQREKKYRFSFCLAPYRSLHFGFEGRVYPCHNNNSLSYGIIGKNSLFDLWNGKVKKKYIKSLRKNNLDNVGCLQCIKDIEQKNYASVNSLRYDFDYIKKKMDYPDIMGFRFSDKCNLRCIMCFSNHTDRKSDNNENIVYNKSFFKELRDFIPHLNRAYFLGGEPFFEPLNYQVFNIIQELNPNCNISVQTNGTILNDEVRNTLNKGRFNINVSIDSLDKETLQLIRKGSVYKTLFSNIQEFRDYCNKKNTVFSSCITPMRQNIREMPSIIKYFNHINTKVWINKYYFPAQYAVWTLNSKEIGRIINIFSNIKFITPNDISKYNIIQFHSYIKVLYSYYKDAQIRESNRDSIEVISNKTKQIIISINKKNGVEKNEQILFELYDKLDNINKIKIYYFLKKLTSVFTGDKLSELLLHSNNSVFIEKEIESISI